MKGIREWLERQNLGQYTGSFESNQIDVSMLAELTDGDLKELGVSALGHRKLLLKAVEAPLRVARSSSGELAATPPRTCTARFSRSTCC